MHNSISKDGTFQISYSISYFVPLPLSYSSVAVLLFVFAIQARKTRRAYFTPCQRDFEWFIFDTLSESATGWPLISYFCPAPSPLLSFVRRVGSLCPAQTSVQEEKSLFYLSPTGLRMVHFRHTFQISYWVAFDQLLVPPPLPRSLVRR